MRALRSKLRRALTCSRADASLCPVGRRTFPPMRRFARPILACEVEPLMSVRKLVFVTEEISTHVGRKLEPPLRRVAALVIVDNPLALQSVEDLSALIELGAELGESVMPRVAEMLGGSALTYGK